MSDITRRSFLRTAAGLFVTAAGVAYVPKVIYSFPSPRKEWTMLEWDDNDLIVMPPLSKYDAFEVHHRFSFTYEALR